MRQTVPSHPEIALQIYKRFFFWCLCIAVVFFTPKNLQANSPSNHNGELVIAFTFVPADITAECSNVPAPITPTADDNCPGDLTISLNESSTQTFNGGCTDFNYNITRTWTATNGCGEVATAAQTVTVLDTKAPALSDLPADVTLFQAQGQTVPVNNITAFDDCGGAIQIDFNEGIGNGGCMQSIGRTWIATDACGNSFNHSQQITYILDWFLVPQVTPETCNQPGSISISANNGSGEYIAVWQDFPTNNTVFQGGLTAGDYFMYIVDELSGCKEEITITVPFDCDPLACTANAGTITANGGVPCQDFVGQPINISGTPNGNMTVPTGYQVTYVLTEGTDLIIQDAQATPNFVVSNPGNYTVHTLVFDPNTLDLGIIIQIGVTSAFAVNGLLQQGGGAICASLDVTGAGVLVTACEVMCTNPVIDNIVVLESTCNNSVGSINITMTTPNTDYSYTWNPAVSSNNMATNLASSVYNVTITSNTNASCFITETIVVGNSNGPQGEVVSMSPANCSENNGLVTVGPTNLSFNWGTVGAPDPNNQDFGRINLNAGTYIVTVTDPNSTCLNLLEVTVDQFNNINGDFVIGAQPDPGQANGAVIITTGAMGAFLYKWSDGVQQDSPNRFDLAEGNYCVTICDTQNTGCEDIVCFVLGSNNPNCNASISLASDLISVSCVGESDGMIQFTTDFPAGCIEPSTVQIVNANGGAVVTNGTLSPGNYCVVLSEGNGSIAASECFEVIEPDQILLDIQPFPVTCATSGSILLEVTGGSDPYTYLWSPDGSILEDRVDLQAGTYIVTVTDNAGCQAISPAIIVADECDFICNPATVDNVVVVESTCGDSIGLVSVDLFEDIAGYSFAWSPDLGVPGATDNIREDVPAGSYTVTIIDNLDANCITEVVAVVGNVDGPEASIFATFPATCAEANGTATIIPEDFEYTWSDGSMLDSRTDLLAGIYQITVVDPMGDPECFNVIEVEITSISPVGLVVNIQDEPDCGQANGLAIVGAFGGAGPYSFVWSDGFVNQDATQQNVHPNIASGNYCVTVTDLGNLGCVEVECFVVLNNLADDACATVNLEADTIFTTCAGTADGMINFTTDFCVNFVQPATTEIFTSGNLATNGSLVPGEYCIVVSDGNQCVAGEACFTVLNQESIDIDIEITPISCLTGGIINVIASGGTGDYTFTWDPTSPDTSAITDLDLGIFSLTVTDSNGCTTSASNLNITDACLITTETLFDSIPLIGGPYGPLCADTTELLGTIISFENICPEESGNFVDFDFDDETFCVTYDPIAFGTDTYCLVLCDDTGVCDTTNFVVTVVPGDGDVPLLSPDMANTIKNSSIVISVAENDVMIEDFLSFGIVDQPNNGDAQQNEISRTITYSPSLDFCGGTDEFTYFFANENGADTTTVIVEVSCECLVIYDGFSPNGDNDNEEWIIEGIENFPDNEVCVYNRWGNQVYRKQGYSNNNPFIGNWEGNALPSGTYFYVINTGNGGETFNGILQINR